jgi:hypothetical protein
MTLRKIMARYDRLRSKYFMDADPPLRVPPPASDLRWYWLSEAAKSHGLTHFDEDGDPDSVGLDPSLRRSGRFLLTTLLHELTHMRDPALNCGKTGCSPAAWLREQGRLAALGAPLL